VALGPPPARLRSPSVWRWSACRAAQRRRPPDAVRSAASEFRREPGATAFCANGVSTESRRTGYLLATSMAAADIRARPSICPGVTSKRRSEWRSAIKRRRVNTLQPA